MKTAVILLDDIKQIVFTPENDSEKYALSLITVDDNIDLLIEDGTFGGKHLKPFTATISECQGKYLRVFNDEESRILLLTPKKK